MKIRGCLLHVVLRPYLRELLHELAQHFELVMFSLGTDYYVEEILKIIDPEHKLFRFVLSREHNSKYVDRRVLKDLSQLYSRRAPEDVIMIDNKEHGIIQIKNVVPITDFEGDHNDRALKLLLPYLMSFKEETNVSEKII